MENLTKDWLQGSTENLAAVYLPHYNSNPLKNTEILAVQLLRKALYAWVEVKPGTSVTQAQCLTTKLFVLDSCDNWRKIQWKCFAIYPFLDILTFSTVILILLSKLIELVLGPKYLAYT